MPSYQRINAANVTRGPRGYKKIRHLSSTMIEGKFPLQMSDIFCIFLESTLILQPGLVNVEALSASCNVSDLVDWFTSISTYQSLVISESSPSRPQ